MPDGNINTPARWSVGVWGGLGSLRGVGCICGTNEHIFGSCDSFVRGGLQRRGSSVLAIDDAGMWGRKGG